MSWLSFNSFCKNADTEVASFPQKWMAVDSGIPMALFLHTFFRKCPSSFRIPRNPFKTNRVHPELLIFYLSVHVR